MNERLKAQIDRIKPIIVNRIYDLSVKWGEQSQLFPTMPENLSDLETRVWKFLNSSEFHRSVNKDDKEDLLDVLTERFGKIPSTIPNSYPETEIPVYVTLTSLNENIGVKVGIPLLKKYTQIWMTGVGQDRIELFSDKIHSTNIRIASKEEIQFLVNNCFLEKVGGLAPWAMYNGLLKNSKDKEQRELVLQKITEINENFFEKEPKLSQSLSKQELEIFTDKDFDLKAKQKMIKVLGLEWSDKKWKEWEALETNKIDNWDNYVCIVYKKKVESLKPDTVIIQGGFKNNSIFIETNQINGQVLDEFQSVGWSDIRKPTTEELKYFVDNMNLGAALNLLANSESEDEIAELWEGMS